MFAERKGIQTHKRIKDWFAVYCDESGVSPFRPNFAKMIQSLSLTDSMFQWLLYIIDRQGIMVPIDDLEKNRCQSQAKRTICGEMDVGRPAQNLLAAVLLYRVGQVDPEFTFGSIANEAATIKGIFKVQMEATFPVNFDCVLDALLTGALKLKVEK